MQKLLKKSTSNKKKIGCPAFVHNSNDLFHSICDQTREKFVTIQPVHMAPLPASKQFLENYDEIDWGHKEKVEG